MAMNWRGDDNGIDVSGVDDGRRVGRRFESTKLLLGERKASAYGVADANDVRPIDRAEIADMVGAPLSKTDHPDPDRRAEN